MYIVYRKRNENTYKWTRKDLLVNSTLISSTDVFRQDCVRYEITKFSSRKCFCHLQGGNYEF